MAEHTYVRTLQTMKLAGGCWGAGEITFDVRSVKWFRDSPKSPDVQVMCLDYGTRGEGYLVGVVCNHTSMIVLVGHDDYPPKDSIDDAAIAAAEGGEE